VVLEGIVPERLELVVQMFESESVFRSVVTFQNITDTHPGDVSDTFIVGLAGERGQGAQEVLPGSETFCAWFMTAAMPERC